MAQNVRGPSLFRAFKRLVVGKPISSHHEIHSRLNKRTALAVFSSDALSSSAYATDEILLVLMTAGTAAIVYSRPIALAVVLILGVVITSYRQTVRAYPQGGGAYIVAHDNLGVAPGLIAASALLIDYVLTVSVSVAAGIAAISAAFPAVRDHRVGAALLIVLFVTLMNLRGLKESGQLFAIPTYGFLISMGVMIAVGLFKVATGDFEPLPQHAIEAHRDLTLLLILRAFSSGCTALTGIEAISDGVPAFKPPEWKNAAATLLILGVLLGALFFGITTLGNAYHVDPELIESGRTVTSQIARGVFGDGHPLFFVIQGVTALILFLAANTAYADFPRLVSILARDRFLPSVFKARGDKLAFSNGIIILALAAAGLLIRYQADVHRIIPLYVVGVFTSFTLSQSGMVSYWFRRKTEGWRRAAAINGFGASVTFVVLIIVAVSKFRAGAWQVIFLIPVVAWVLYRIRSHYHFVSHQLRTGHVEERIAANKIIVLASRVPGGTVKALSFARALNPRRLRLVAFRVPEARLRLTRRMWSEIGSEIPIEATGHRISDLIEFIRDMEPTDSEPVTVVVPDIQLSNPLAQLRSNYHLLRIKRALLFHAGVIVASVPFHPELERAPDRLILPARLAIIVPVSAVHRATLRALRYAESLNPAELKAVIIATDAGQVNQLIEEWQRWGIDIPIEAVDSPYRSLVQPIIKEVRALRHGPDDAVGVVIPEFVVRKWWKQLLHNQSAFLLKTALLFEHNVFVIDVPYIVGSKAEPAETEETELSRIT